MESFLIFGLGVFVGAVLIVCAQKIWGAFRAESLVDEDPVKTARESVYRPGLFRGDLWFDESERGSGGGVIELEDRSEFGLSAPASDSLEFDEDSGSQVIELEDSSEFYGVDLPGDSEQLPMTDQPARSSWFSRFFS